MFSTPFFVVLTVLRAIGSACRTVRPSTIGPANRPWAPFTLQAVLPDIRQEMPCRGLRGMADADLAMELCNNTPKPEGNAVNV
jgi:hypothetical protein